tara:strand:- start:3447 stop:4661 length:1215 start_codon:yes stop_codon:yes gene_type:complete
LEKKNLVLFTDSFYFEDSTSQYNSQIAKNLSKENNVTVVCAKNIFSKNPTFEKVNKNLNIVRLPSLFTNSKIISLKLIKFISFSLSITIYLFFKKRKKEVFLICTSPPIILPPIILITKLKELFKRKIIKKVLLGQDIYPDLLGEEKNLKNIKNIFISFLNLIYKKTYKEFDVAISCCEPIKEKLVRKYNLANDQVKVINNWSLVDKNFIDSHISKKLTDKTKIKMFIIGNLGKPHLYKQTTKSLENILKKSKLIEELHMYTRGCYHIDVYNQLKKLGNVYLHNIIKADDLSKVYAGPSITIVPLSQVVSLCAFPSRIATAVSLGSPILVITDYLENNYLAYFVKKYNIGLVINKSIEPNKDDWISNQFKLNFNIYQENCLNLYKELFTKEKNLDQILNIIQKL